MKYIVLIIGLLVVGCGKQEKADTNESTPTTTAKPVKELTLEEKVVGAYEIKGGEYTIKIILLENGGGEAYVNGKKQEEDMKWKMAGNEVHVAEIGISIAVFKIEPNGDLTPIAEIISARRKGIPKEEQQTINKIK